MKHIKNILVIALVLLITQVVIAFADTSKIGVYIDGEEIVFHDVGPYIKDGRTFVPVRFISEQLGASIDWNGDTGTVYINKDGAKIQLAVGSTGAIRNGIPISMDAPPEMVNDRVMVPLRFISEQIGVSVEWNELNNSIKISKESPESTYIVQTGDTFFNIAKCSGLSMEALLYLNPGIDPDNLKIGQTINVPPGIQVKETSRGGSRFNKSFEVDCTADELVGHAMQYLNVPYVYGGASPSGFDCSGLTQYVFANFGVNLPHSAVGQYSYGQRVGRDALEKGDMVFFTSKDDQSTIGHVGIFIGNGEFIHAPLPGDVVKVSRLSNEYFDQHYFGATRMNFNSE